MICGDIWHKYHKWYFKIVVRNFTSPSGEWNLRQFWNSTSGIYAKYHVQIMLLFVYTPTHKRVVIFTCMYFKLSWNTTALSKSNCRNFSCSSIIIKITARRDSPQTQRNWQRPGDRNPPITAHTLTSLWLSCFLRGVNN